MRSFWTSWKEVGWFDPRFFWRGLRPFYLPERSFLSNPKKFTWGWASHLPPICFARWGLFAFLAEKRSKQSLLRLGSGPKAWTPWDSINIKLIIASHRTGFCFPCRKAEQAEQKKTLDCQTWFWSCLRRGTTKKNKMTSKKKPRSERMRIENSFDFQIYISFL